MQERVLARRVRRAGWIVAAAATIAVGCTPDGGGGGTTTTAGPTTTTIPVGTPTRQFLLRTDIAAGTKALYVQAADMNGDGRRDIVTVTGSATAAVVSVQLALPSGGYAAHVDYAGGGVILGIAVGDVDDDGDADVVAANGASGTVSFLGGNGDGTLAAPVATTVGGSLGSTLGNSAIDLGDLDGDGDLDVVVADSTEASRAWVLDWVGGGTFAPTAVPVSQTRSRSTVLRDLDGDGDLDLVTGSDSQTGLSFPNSTVGAHLNAGDGSFPTRQDVALASFSFSLGVGDIDGDSHPDVAVVPYAGADTGRIVTVRGSATGTLGAVVPAPRLVFSNGAPNAVVVADMDGDGRGDLVMSDRNRNEVMVAPAAPGGTFSVAHGYFASGNGGNGNRSIDVADMDGDGELDVVWAAADTSRVQIYRGRGDGSLAAMGNVYDVAGDRITMGDATGDGIVDIVSAEGTRGRFHIARGLGDGRFGFAEEITVGGVIVDVATGDVDGDSVPDVVSANRSLNSVSVSLGTGGGAFAAPTNYAAGATTNAVVLADLDLDGDLDIVATSTGSGGVSVLRGNGDGTFAAAVAVPTGTSPLDTAVGDVDEDGIVDLAVSNSASNTVSVLVGNGDGTFAAPLNLATGVSPRELTVADVDNDGNVDVVVPAYTDQTVNVFPGNGDGTFDARQDTATLGKVTGVAVADFDGDGRADVAVASHDNNVGLLGLGVLYGTGGGALAPPVSYLLTPTYSVYGLAVGDINGDSTPDLAFSEVGQSWLHWMITG